MAITAEADTNASAIGVFEFVRYFKMKNNAAQLSTKPDKPMNNSF